MHILDMNGKWLDEHTVRRAQHAGRVFLVTLQKMAHEAWNENHHLWKIRPKCHYFDHHLCDLASGFNPPGPKEERHRCLPLPFTCQEKWKWGGGARTEGARGAVVVSTLWPWKSEVPPLFCRRRFNGNCLSHRAGVPQSFGTPQSSPALSDDSLPPVEARAGEGKSGSTRLFLDLIPLSLPHPFFPPLPPSSPCPFETPPPAPPHPSSPSPLCCSA